MNRARSCESRESIDPVSNVIEALSRSHLARLHDKPHNQASHPQSFINHQKTSKPKAFKHKFKSHLALIHKTLPQKWFRRWKSQFVCGDSHFLHKLEVYQKYARDKKYNWLGFVGWNPINFFSFCFSTAASPTFIHESSTKRRKKFRLAVT